MKRLVGWLATAVFASICWSASVPAHEGYPILLDAKYQEIKRGGKIKRMIFVNGHAHYPNGTRIAVGLRLEEQQQYLAWYNGVVKNQSFIVEMGPWNKDFASGMYIIEAWFIWERQSSSVQGAIKKAEEGLERGVDNCNPEIVAERKRCKTKSVFGACVVQVGTPGRFILEEEDTRNFLTQVHETLSTVFKEVETEQKIHAQPEKGPDVTVDTWTAKTQDWIPRLQEVDDVVVKWHQSKLTVRHQKAYTAAVNAGMGILGLIGTYGQEMYDVPNEFMGSGTSESGRTEVSNHLNQLLEDLKAPEEEGGESAEGGEGGTEPREK